MNSIPGTLVKLFILNLIILFVMPFLDVHPLPAYYRVEYFFSASCSRNICFHEYLLMLYAFILTAALILLFLREEKTHDSAHVS